MATKQGATTKYWDRKSLHYEVPIFLVVKNKERQFLKLKTHIL
jgi:hypothetical protein